MRKIEQVARTFPSGLKSAAIMSFTIALATLVWWAGFPKSAFAMVSIHALCFAYAAGTIAKSVKEIHDLAATLEQGKGK